MICITCGKNEAVNDFYKECEGCIDEYQKQQEKDRKLFMKLVYIRMLLDEDVSKGKQSLTMLIKNEFNIKRKEG